MEENEKLQWYVVSTFKNKERSVREALEIRRVTLGVEKEIHRVIDGIVDTGKFDKKGKPILENRYEGYIFVEMEMTEKAWFIVRNTKDVSGFIGSSGKGTKPSPMSKEEIEAVFRNLKLSNESFKVGEKVNGVGLYEGQVFTIIRVNEEEQTCDVQWENFGKLSTKTVDFNQIEKISEND